MITLSRSSLILCLLVVAFFAGATSSQEKAKGLTKEDEKLLESLLRDFLFDPRGAERVEVKVVEAGPAGLRLPPREETRVGWLVKDKVEGGKAGDRVYFTDGANLPAPAKDKITKVDFVGKSREFFANLERAKKEGADVPTIWRHWRLLNKLNEPSGVRKRDAFHGDQGGKGLIANDFLEFAPSVHVIK